MKIIRNINLVFLVKMGFIDRLLKEIFIDLPLLPKADHFVSCSVEEYGSFCEYMVSLKLDLSASLFFRLSDLR